MRAGFSFAQEHGVLLPDVVFVEMFPQAPLPDYVREGAASNSQP